MAQPNHFDGNLGMMGQGRFQKNFGGYQHVPAQENLFENDAFRAFMPGLFQLVRKKLFDQNCGD
jgi:hypothetical protein